MERLVTLEAHFHPDTMLHRGTALRYVDAPVVIADARFPSLPLIDVNTAFERLSGFTAPEVLGHDLRLLEGTRSDSTAMQSVVHAVLDGHSPQIVALHYRKDGSTFWNEITMSPVRGDGGRLTHVIATLRDVSERQQLANLNAALADLMCSDDGPVDEHDLVSHAASALVPHFADHCEVFLCGEQSQLVSAFTARSAQCVSEPEKPSKDERLNAHRMRCIAENEVLVSSDPGAQSFRNMAAGVGQSIVWVPIRSHQQTLGCLEIRRLPPNAALGSSATAVLHRIGARLGADLERDRLLQHARASIATRDQFLSIASHELRTPVASIKGYAQFLNRSRERGTLTEDRLRSGLGTITTSIHRLSGLMDDLLDVSHLGNNDVPIHRELCEIDAFVREIVQRTAPIVPQKLDLRLKSPGVWAMLDKVKLEQVIANLIGNGSKYSAEDDTITVATEPAVDGVLLTVADNGVGIAEDELDHIFEAFSRSRDAIASETAGLGLGLFICRSIVERHDGKIWAERRGASGGTVMNVWLPGQSRLNIKGGNGPG